MIWFLVMTILLLPVSMVGFGLWMWKKPPRDINALLGYRTRRSMSSKQAWDFAHRHFGRIWFYEGLALTGAMVIAAALMWDMLMSSVTGLGAGSSALTGADKIVLIIIFIQLVAMIAPIFVTERALRMNFDKRGRPSSE